MLNRNFKRVVQLELNELSYSIVQKLTANGKLPTFQLMMRDWFRYETSSETRYELIEPWIQWVSVHTGQSFEEHRIFHLGDQSQLSAPQIWETLERFGLTSCVVSAMNSRRGEMSRGVFIPDPWAPKDETLPRELSPLWRLLSKKIKGHASAGRISIADLFSAGLVCLKLGLSPSLYLQLFREFILTTLQRSKRWRLASALDQLLTAVFAAVVRKTKPTFASLFLNSVAHYQHHYWRNFDRAGFNESVLSPDCAFSDDPVTFGYERLDRCLGNLIREFENGETLFIVASGLSQEAFHDHEDDGGMNYYRLKNHQDFVAKLGLTKIAVYPLMSRDWRIESSNNGSMKQALAALSNTRVEGEPLFKLQEVSGTEVFVETQITRAVSPFAPVKNADGATVGTFSELFTNTAVKSGHHTGIGTVWLSSPLAGVAGGASIPVTTIHDIGVEALRSSFTAASQTKNVADSGNEALSGLNP